MDGESSSETESDQETKKLVETVESHYCARDTGGSESEEEDMAAKTMNEQALLAVLRQSAKKAKKGKQQDVKPKKKTKKTKKKITVTELQKQVKGLNSAGRKKILEALLSGKN